MATADEIDPETLIPPQWGLTWTLPEAHEILIGPKNDPFCFVVFPGADSVSETFLYRVSEGKVFFFNLALRERNIQVRLYLKVVLKS